MYDRETESLWVHVTGRAQSGPLEGSQLEMIPSTVTTWAQWKRAHPDTLVLPGRRRGGFMGTYTGLRDPDPIGLAVTVRFKPKLYPYRALEKSPVVNDEHNGEAVLVVYSSDAGTASAWGRTLDGRALTFQIGEHSEAQGTFLLRDAETGSTWSWLTGEALSGPLEGKRLALLPHHPILNKRFPGFYPDAPVMGR